jgi:hypothetical protein
MALKKKITLPSGASGDYISVGAYTWDQITREASAHLMLHASAAQAAARPDAPLCLIAKVRLSGDKFDEYLGKKVLVSKGVTALGQIYEAAKAEELIPGGGLTRDELSLRDAADV